jgi:hypothetical protein
VLSVRADGRAVLTRELVVSAGEHVKLSLEASLLETATVDAELLPKASRASARASARAAQSEQAVGATSQSASELLASARQAMREGDFSRAAREYEALREAEPASTEARAVLLSLAELELEHLAAPRRALQHAEQYLRAGAGPLAPEARELRIRALAELGRRDEERAAIEELLDRHPEHLRAAALTRRLKDLEERSSTP